VLLACKKERIEPEVQGTWRLERDSANIDRYLLNACDEYSYYGLFGYSSPPPDPCYFTVSKKDVQLGNFSCINLYTPTSNNTWAFAKDGQIYITYRNSSFPNVAARTQKAYYFDYKLVGDVLWLVRETSDTKVDATVEGMRFVR